MIISGALASHAGLWAEALELTPSQGAGPFYPLWDDIPLGRDNDLVLLHNSDNPAQGTVSHITGTVFDKNEKPVKGALVELWHADSKGVYTYFQGAGPNPQADRHFAGIGQYLTGRNGRYRFRTIEPGLYPGRTRHFHWGITLPGQQRRFTTQTYWHGEPLNNQDGLYRSITNINQREAVTLKFDSVPGSLVSENQAVWDIKLNAIPDDTQYPDPATGILTIHAEPSSLKINGRPTVRLHFQAYKGFSYEIYQNPELANISWAAIPFSTRDGNAFNQNIFTAEQDGELDLFVEASSGFNAFRVAFREPGANLGTP